MTRRREWPFAMFSEIYHSPQKLVGEENLVVEGFYYGINMYM